MIPMPSPKADQTIADVINGILPGDDAISMQEKAARLISKFLEADSVVVKDLLKAGAVTTQAEEFVLNGGKPYLDNRLSGYSAFADLINYYNLGFKSCLMLPIAVEGNAFGVITLLSKKEDAFEGAWMSTLTLLSRFLSVEAESRVERKRRAEFECYFNAAFESPAAQIIVDRKWLIIKANKAAAALLKRQTSDLYGLNIGRFLEISDVLKAAIIKGSETEVTYRGGSGSVDISPREMNGGLIHLLLEDKSRYRWLEDKFRLLSLGSISAFLEMGEDTEITWASNNIGEIIGIEYDAIVGRKLSDISDISLEQGAEKFARQLKVEVGNGVRTYAKVEVFKRPGGYSVVISNDRERYVEGLMKSMDWMANASSEAIITVDGNGCIDNLNQSAEKLLGRRRDELESALIFSICSDEESKKRLAAALSMTKEGNTMSDVFVNVSGRVGTEPVPLLESVMPIFDTEGKFIGHMLMGKELATKRELEKMRDTLEYTGRQIEKLKAESELKSQFIYNISHDLKTPITSIKGFSKLLVSGEFGQLTQEQAKSVQIIIAESDRLMQLIQQILDVAKLSSGKIKLDIQKVSFVTIKENPSINSLSEVAAGKGLTFSFIIDYNVPEIEADPNRLIQVFVNLIGNAIKFTENGSIDVSVTRKGKNVRVEVKDTGIGIGKEDKSKLFKKFYQIRRGLTHQEGAGTGLGLTIAKEIVNLHGGRIGATSEPGKGSVFWFTLPVYMKEKKKAQDD